MDEIDFSDSKKNKRGMYLARGRGLVFSVALVLLTFILLFGKYRWDTIKSKFEKSILQENFEEAKKHYSVLNKYPFNKTVLGSLNNKLRRLEFTDGIYKTLKKYPWYDVPFGGEFQRWDSVTYVLDLIRKYEKNYKDVLNTSDKIDLGLLKLKGVSKALLHKSNFDFGNDTNKQIAYSVFNSNEKTFANSLNSPENIGIFKTYEMEAIKLLEELKISINDLESTDSYKWKTSLTYYQFILDPTIENLYAFLPENHNLNQESFDNRLLLAIYRLQGTSNTGAHLKVNEGVPVIDALFGILERRVLCADCEINDNILIHYLSSSGLYSSLVNQVAASNKSYFDLKTDINNIERAFGNTMIYREEKDEDYLEILGKYATYLYYTKDHNKLIILRNSIEDELLDKGFDLTAINSLDIYSKTQLAIIYYYDSWIRWSKQDFEELIADYQKINDLLNLAESTAKFETESLLKPSYILRNWWAAKVNLGEIDGCIYLKKASDLNPKEFYDDYLKNCLSK